MWRIANGFLPTMYNLKIRHLAANTLCPVCRAEEETVEHLFMDCSFTRQVLRGLGVSISTCNREPIWKKWLETEFVSQNTEARKIRSIAYWAIWYNHNKIYHEGVREQVNKVVGFVRAYYAESNFMKEVFKNTYEAHSLVWKPLDNDIIKINFDASFNQVTKISVSGIIARNRKGLVMAACTFPWENVSDPVTAEARACLQAITMAEEMGFRYICIEGDVLTIVRKLNSRVANIVAHEMAKEGCCYEFPRFLIEEAPPTVESLVNQDRRNGVVER